MKEELQAHLTIVPAAGSGARLGLDVPKAFAPLAGEPLICTTLRHLHNSGACPQIVLVADPPSVEFRDPTIYRRFGCPGVGKVIPGGSTRHESVLRGLAAFPLDADSLVLIHDGARPIVGADDVQAVLAAAREHGAAVGGWLVSDTVKRVDDDLRFSGSVNRDGLFAVATPQAFRFEVLNKAIKAAGKEAAGATDESSLVQAAGLPVVGVPVSRFNFKVTFPQDLKDAERHLQMAAALT